MVCSTLQMPSKGVDTLTIANSSTAYSFGCGGDDILPFLDGNRAGERARYGGECVNEIESGEREFRERVWKEEERDRFERAFREKEREREKQKEKESEGTT